jgi:AAHS family benzoate transporter-like MFS transporter
MKSINPIRVIDNSRVHSFHLLLTMMLFLIIFFDGYDMVIYGAVVPSLIDAWGISDVTAGAIGSYTVVGTAVGAATLGMAADKFGRKKLIIFSTVLFSLFTFLAGFTTGPTMFIIFRLIAGLGMGGIMPNIIAMMTEFSPKRIRTGMVSLVFAGYSVGAIVAALVSRAILPVGGLEPVFLLGGLPMVLLPFIMKYLPESTNFLLSKGKVEEAKLILMKIDSSIPVDVIVELPVATKAGSPIGKLFKDKRAFSTLMFWFACFFAMILIFSMNTWLPTLLMQAGFDLSSSLIFVVVLQVGALIGTIVFGNLVDKMGFKKVLVPLFFAGAIGLGLIGFTKNIIIMYLLIAIIGAASIGVQNIMSASISQYYPSEIRSTAIGSTMAFGRIGGIIAPVIIGILLTMNLQPQFNFGAIGTAALFGGIALLFVQEKHATYSLDLNMQNLESNKTASSSVSEGIGSVETEEIPTAETMR